MDQGNPLFNHIVIGKILEKGNFSLEDLKNFRQVCRSWCHESLPLFRRTGFIHIIEDLDMVDSSQYDKIVGVTLADFKDFLEDTSSNELARAPFRKIKFTGREPSFEALLKQVAHSLEYIRFHNFTIFGKLEPMIQVPIVCKERPDLKVWVKAKDALAAAKLRKGFITGTVLGSSFSNPELHINRNLAGLQFTPCEPRVDLASTEKASTTRIRKPKAKQTNKQNINTRD